MGVSRRALVFITVIIGSIGALRAWSGDETRRDPPPRPVNLQVLPPDTAPKNLGVLMKRYEKDLGVGCNYCHVENRDTGKVDYVSDENPMKHTARVMIGMLSDINEKHLAQLGDRRYAVPVTCGSCHQGQTSPPTFEARAQ